MRGYKRGVTAIIFILGIVCTVTIATAQEKGIAGKVTVEQIQQERPNRWAILIGVDEYDEPAFGKLKYCAADMRLLRDVLVSSAGGFQSEHVLLMTYDAPEKLHRPSRSNILRMIPRWLMDVKPGDDVLLAFSGHGIEKDNETYLLPTDAIEKNLPLSSISLTMVRKWLQDCKARNKVLLLDCCRAQPDAPHKGSEGVMSKGFAGAVHGLTAAGGFGLLTACAPGERSYEDAERQHGIFTFFLVEALRGAGDLDKDGRVDVNEAYRFAFEHVTTWARKKALRQNPVSDCQLVGVPTLAYRIAEKKLNLVLICNEPGAEVWVNGRKLGVTLGENREQEIQLRDASSYQVLVNKPGFQMATFELTPGDRDTVKREVSLKVVQKGSDLALAIELTKEDPAMARKLLERIIAKKQADAPRAALMIVQDELRKENLREAESWAAKLAQGWAGSPELKEAETTIWDAYQKQIGNPPAGGATVVYLRRKIDVLKSFMQKNPASHHKREAEQEIADCRKGVLAAYRAEANGIAALARQSMRRGEFDDAVKHIESIESSIRETRQQDGIAPDDELKAIPETLAAELTAAVRTDLVSKIEKAEGAIREAIGRKDWNAAHGVEKAIKVSIASAARYDVSVPAEWNTRMEAVLKDLRAGEEADRPVLVIADPTVSAASDPGAPAAANAEIAINGAKQRPTTPARFDVEKGKTYQVEVTKQAGNGTFDSWSTTVRIDRGGPYNLSPALKWAKTPPAPEWAKGRVSKEQMDAAARLGIPVALENSIGMRFVLIPPGEFMMGSKISAEEVNRRWPGGKAEYYEDEHPRHKVKITKPFYLSVKETTVGEFRRFVETKRYKTDAENAGKAYALKDGKWGLHEGVAWRNPGFSQSDAHPVVCVSWNDAKAFCDWLAQKESKSYGLPTEAQWEYACLAGTDGIWWWGDKEEDAQGRANVPGEGEDLNWPLKFKGVRDGYTYTAPAGGFKPNAWGLYDTIGNVWEWCEDWYDKDYYGNSPPADPKGAANGSYRVLRGGSWNLSPWFSRASFRGRYSPTYAFSHYGFRVCLLARTLP